MSEASGMKWQQPGYSDWIWVPYLRRCRVGDDKVELTPPVIFGRGYIFDQAQQMVTMRRCFLGRTLSEQEIPFSGVYIFLGSIQHPPVSGYYGTFSPGGAEHFIKMTVYGSGQVKVCNVPSPVTSNRAQRILAAIRKMGL